MESWKPLLTPTITPELRPGPTAIGTRSHEWLHFSDDCTNFLSTALNSGGRYLMVGGPSDGLTNDHYWYERKPGAIIWTSHSWTVANDQFNFQDVDHDGGAIKAIVSSRSQMQSNYLPNQVGLESGDEIFYIWQGGGSSMQHVALEVGKGVVRNYNFSADRVDEHTTNRLDAFWSLWRYNFHRNTTVIYLVHLY